MVTHEEENAQKRDKESNSFHVVPIYCCLYLKTEGGKKMCVYIYFFSIYSFCGLSFKASKFLFLQPLFKVSIPASSQTNMTITCQKATDLEHKLQDVLWICAKPSIPPGQAHIIFPLSSKGRKGRVLLEVTHSICGRAKNFTGEFQILSVSFYHKIIQPLIKPLLHMACTL